MCFAIFGCTEMLPDDVKTLKHHVKQRNEPVLMAYMKQHTFQSDASLHPLNYYFNSSEFWDYIYDEVDPFGEISNFRPPNRYYKNCSSTYSRALKNCNDLECMRRSYEDLLRCYQIYMLPEVIVVRNREENDDT